ncbi:MAG: hypothetical protein HQ581_05040, partial [Planctomycetes bacterium]|nr:hypothetical protein [Planctomycetota bacterium]
MAGLFVGLIFAGNLVPAWAQTTIRNPAASAIPKAPLPDAIDATAGDTVAPVVPEPIDPETPQMGHPSAPGLMTLLHNEMATGMKKRKIEGKFTQFRRYTAGKLNATAGPRTGSELTGNCRLKWYDHLMRNPLEAPIEAEQFTRQLHQDMCGDHRGLERAMVTAGLKLDLAIGSPRSFAPVGSPDEALDTVKQALTNAQLYYASALAPLTKAEVQELVRGLYPILTGQCKVGHTLASRSSGRRLCNLMEKIDRTAMHRAAMALVPLTDPDLLQQLGQLDQSTTLAVGPTAVAGTTGPIVGRIDTPGGTIVIGDRGTNTYQLDSMAGVNVVIDLGGNDVYYEGTVSTGRPVLIVIDLDGNDAYRGKKPGIQGSGILGISMLLDAAGSDTYLAADV